MAHLLPTVSRIDEKSMRGLAVRDKSSCVLSLAASYVFRPDTLSAVIVLFTAEGNLLALRTPWSRLSMVSSSRRASRDVH